MEYLDPLRKLHLTVILKKPEVDDFCGSSSTGTPYASNSFQMGRRDNLLMYGILGTITYI